MKILCVESYSAFDQTRFLKTVVALSGHDDVIQNAKAEDFAGFGQLIVHA